MLGEYGDKDNERRLEEFQNRDTNDTEFLLVINKANEGLHLDKLDGMIWLRPMDENSRILYLQQLGRVIYSENPDNPTKDEDRPVVIDLVNNTLKVNWKNEITEQDDIELLNIIVNWTEAHDGLLPNINSADKEETGYAIALKEIQDKYKGYLDSDFENLKDKKIEEIQEILRLGSLIDLWQSELPEKLSKNGESKVISIADRNVGPFKITGILDDFVKLQDEVEEFDARTTVEKFIDKIERLCSIGVDVSKLTAHDTIETLAKKSEVEVEKIKKIGLNPKEKIGSKKSTIARVMRGKAILFNLFRDYLATQEQKEKIIKMQNEERQKNELEKQKQYNIDVFANKYNQNKTERIDEIQLVEYKENIFKKLLNKIKSFFSKK